MVTQSYPDVRSVLSRQISICDTRMGHLTLVLSTETPVSEMNQLILDLLVQTLKGEENRRIAKLGLKKRDVILEAVGYSAARLIKEMSASSIIEILHKFVINMGISEAHIFVWNTVPGENPVLTHDYLWAEEIPGYSQDHLTWHDLVQSPLCLILSSVDNQCIVAGSIDLSPEEYQFLENPWYQIPCPDSVYL